MPLTVIRGRGSPPVTGGKLLGELAALVSGRAACAGSTGEGDLPSANTKNGGKEALGWKPGRWELAKGSQETCQQRAVPHVSTLEATGGPEMRIST